MIRNDDGFDSLTKDVWKTVGDLLETVKRLRAYAVNVVAKWYYWCVLITNRYDVG